MHLGFTDGAFVPHNLISAQENPVPLPKMQMTPRLIILMSSGFKKGTHYILFFSLKSSDKCIPSRYPNGASMGRDARIQSLS